MQAKPPKEDSDDTTSNGTEDSDLPEVNARRSRRATRRSYKSFVKENKPFWRCFNVSIVFFSLGFAVGTYFIFEDDSERDDCGGIQFVLYGVIALHMVNFMVGFINLIGKEVACCNQNMVTCLSIFEVTILVWMQISYFRAQDDNCMTRAPLYYFWLML